MDAMKICQQSVCPCCGASWINNYQHDPDCRSNAPWPIEHTAHYWNYGAQDALSGKLHQLVGMLKLTQPSVQQKVAYMQGWFCTRRKLHRGSERTLQSLDQAIDLAKGRQQRDHVTLDPSPAT